MFRQTSFGVMLYRVLSYPYPYRTAFLRMALAHFPSCRPHYLACMFDAALLARNLGYAKISAIEFGVAGGHGLLAIERYSNLVFKKTGVQFESYGFDMGDAQGLPKPEDYRDMPYLWEAGDYAMDEEALRKRLRRSKLYLGDVSTTVKDFVRDDPAPLGTCFFDLDYWSSTTHALKLFDLIGENTLPRVTCYFDDVDVSSDYTGVLAAISDFNLAHPQKKIFRMHGHHHDQKFGMLADRICHVHDFRHPAYNRYIPGVTAKQLPLS